MVESRDTPDPEGREHRAYTAPLDGGLIARKGAAVPAPAAPMACATTTAEQPREDSLALTVKLDPELYFQLKRRGMRTKPRKPNQEMIVEAIKASLGQAEDKGMSAQPIGADHCTREEGDITSTGQDEEMP
jgi:hypothetical protein